MNINDVFKILKFRANKSGYGGYISADDFNLLFNSAQIRYFNKLFGNQNQYQIGNPLPPIAYPGTLKVSTSLSKFKAIENLTIGADGRANKPQGMLYVDSLSHVVSSTNLPTSIKRVEQQDLSDALYSYYESPTELFPIYVEYDTYIQFYPITLGTATLNYLGSPQAVKWVYTLTGSIDTLGTITGGSGYADGVYTNVPLTGNGATANITVVSGIVTQVILNTSGFGYQQGDELSASNILLGGTGSGFSILVATIKKAREQYNPADSIDPQWSDVDIDEILYLVMKDLGINVRDNEIEQFAQQESKTGGI